MSFYFYLQSLNPLYPFNPFNYTIITDINAIIHENTKQICTAESETSSTGAFVGEAVVGGLVGSRVQSLHSGDRDGVLVGGILGSVGCTLGISVGDVVG